LGEVGTVKGGKRVPKSYRLLEYVTKHIYIRVTDMKNGTINSDNLRYIDNTIFAQIKNYTIGKDDLYLTIAGTIGNVGVVPEIFDGMNLTENAVKLTNLKIDKHILLYFLQSTFLQEQFIYKTNQVAQPKLAIERINTTLLPLPPLAEQERIVKKIEALMFACNKLI
jgi:type I restriction enzyme S subunit